MGPEHVDHAVLSRPLVPVQGQKAELTWKPICKKSALKNFLWQRGGMCANPMIVWRRKIIYLLLFQWLLTSKHILIIERDTKLLQRLHWTLAFASSFCRVQYFHATSLILNECDTFKLKTWLMVELKPTHRRLRFARSLAAFSKLDWLLKRTQTSICW